MSEKKQRKEGGDQLHTHQRAGCMRSDLGTCIRGPNTHSEVTYAVKKV